MKSPCAYCGSTENKLTREHIWPAAFIKRLPSYTRRYSSRAKKVFAGDLTVGDVCHICNNGPLSDLDAYAIKLYDRYFTKFHEKGESLQFEYDWNLLGRWLLKMSYNASRASDAPEPALANSASYILNNQPPDLAVWLDIAEPSYYEEIKQPGSNIIQVKRVPPAMTRLCRMAIPDCKMEHYILRLVAINAFYFYLAIPVMPYGPVFEEELIRIVEYFGLMTPINVEATSVLAKTSGLSTHNLILPHLQMNKDIYEKFNAPRVTR